MIGRLVVLAALLSPSVGLVADDTGIARQRRDYLRDLLTDSPALVAGLRKGCVRGMAPELQRESLQRGNAWAPDATDACVMILTRHGRDGTLDAMYRTILLELVQDDSGANTLAEEIGSYVTVHRNYSVPLARGVALPVTTALAFDAGFTNGYRNIEKRGTGTGIPELAALKPLTELCLGLKEKSVLACYSAGYMFGLRASRGELVSAAR
jgi:hypothetical protein